MDRGSSDGGGDADDNTSPDPPAAVFPAGSYSFETTLQRTNTSCSSNPAAWRCYPDVQGGNATFFWHVHDVTSGPSPYAVSSTENPFAPSFTNVSATVLDEGTPEERLTFSFDMDKTVVPSDALTPDNTAATCTFPGTRLEATLWTRRRNGTAFEPPTGSDVGDGRFPPWPCDVEIVQTKEGASSEGAPTCEDSDGHPVGDVTSGDGDCACNYANYVL
jgi:hypothetical protein